MVLGSVRARQDRRLDENKDKVIPILMHGDASFAGQGVVMEILQHPKLEHLELAEQYILLSIIKLDLLQAFKRMQDQQSIVLMLAK